MGRVKEYDWEKVRIKWETGQYTMKELADEYGFSPRTGYKMSSAEGWEKGSTENKLQNKLEEKILDNEAQVRKETRLEYYLIFSRLRELIADEILNNENPDRHKLKTIKLGIDALEKCKDAEWDILMLNQTLDNWSSKYRIEKKQVINVMEKNPDIADSLKELYRRSKNNDENIIDIEVDDDEDN